MDIIVGAVMLSLIIAGAVRGGRAYRRRHREPERAGYITIRPGSMNGRYR